jgi:Ca2+-binding RTX toxin-like protein
VANADGNDTPVGIEGLQGSAGNDTLIGMQRQLLLGEGGDDRWRAAPATIRRRRRCFDTATTSADMVVDLAAGTGHRRGQRFLAGPYRAARATTRCSATTMRTCGADGGDDQLAGIGGDDTLAGGLGDDALTAVTLRCRAVQLCDRVCQSCARYCDRRGDDSLTDIEGVQTGAGDDTLVGDSNSNLLTATADLTLSSSIVPMLSMSTLVPETATGAGWIRSPGSRASSAAPATTG